MRHRRIALKLAERRARRAAKRRHWDRVLAAGCAELRWAYIAERERNDRELRAMYTRRVDERLRAEPPRDADTAFGWCAGGGLAS